MIMFAFEKVGSERKGAGLSAGSTADTMATPLSLKRPDR